MSLTTAGAELVLLDTSPLHRFGDHKLAMNLASHLQARARVTAEVWQEVELRAAREEGLRHFVTLGWPPEKQRLVLPTDLQEELLDILRAKNDPAIDHPMKHAGEHATVLLAQRLGGRLTIIDDTDGKRFASQRQVPRISTASLVAEMVVLGQLDDKQGFAVFDTSTPAHVGRSEFERALRAARAELGV